ncbi:MAG: putative DNA binding domain-containing protein [Thiotrichales bacterium]|nr:putative DNA binding domain-containing protein [Thiotrichales bacterium]
MQESQRTEFKRQLTDSLEREVVAFLNAKSGGEIYIGVDDQTQQAIALGDLDSLQLKIKDRIKHNIAPSALGLFDVFITDWHGTDIIKIVVASGLEKPYHLTKFGMTPRGCFLRIGSASEPMPERMIHEFFAQRTRNSISNMRAPYQDLTFEQLKIYYEARGLPLNQHFAKNLELLTEDGQYNYAAYLLADQNGNSIKVAKYSGSDRIDLIENEEYGYCCLVKAAKAVLDKIKVENRTFTQITASTRRQRQMLNEIAVREAVINAIVHNNYTRETPPKFEFFADRLEITSAGSLPEDMNEEDFFSGISHPQNKVLMRVFRDLEMVEHLGSGVPRILQHYSKNSYVFLPNFTRIVLPYAEGFVESLTKTEQTTPQATPQATPQVEAKFAPMLKFCREPKSTAEIMQFLQLKDRKSFREAWLLPMLEVGALEMTQPDKPKSPNQKYKTKDTA